MFEVLVKMKHDWIDLSGVPDVEIFKALSDWSSGKEEYIKLKSFTFKCEDIVHLLINR